jgi:P-type conjugative transfer protein TrbJ
MRRCLLIMALLLVTAGRAHAQDAVLCVNCATLPEQLVSDAKQALQYLKQLDAYAVQLNQYSNQITNTISLPSQAYATVMSDMYAVRSLVRAADILTGNSGSIIQRLQTASYAARAATVLPQNINQQYAYWQKTIGDVTNQLGLTNQSQQQMELSYANLQAKVQFHALGAEGQKQAIQANIEAAHIVSTQLNQMQASQIAIAQQMAVREEVAQDRQAISDQKNYDFFNVPDLPTTGHRQF